MDSSFFSYTNKANVNLSLWQIEKIVHNEESAYYNHGMVMIVRSYHKWQKTLLWATEKGFSHFVTEE